MQYEKYVEVRKFVDVVDRFKKMKKFDQMKDKIAQSKNFAKKLTICIDLESVFLAKIDL